MYTPVPKFSQSGEHQFFGPNSFKKHFSVEYYEKRNLRRTYLK